MSLGDTSPSRRQFVKAVGGSAALTALAGCLGGGGGSSDSVTLTHIAHGGSTQAGEEEMMNQWADQHDDDITIQGDSVSNNIEIMSKVSENPSEYDVSSAMSTNGIKLHDLQFDGEVFAEVDTSRVPNYDKNIKEVWRSDENQVMKDNPWGFMGYISSQGMAYHADHADEPTSWADAKTDDLKVSHFDHGLPRFGNSAAFIGVDPNEALKDTELYQEVFAEVEDQHQYVGTYWGTGDEFMRLYREESAHIGSGWGGRIAVLQQDGLNVGYTVPEEGAYPGGACWTIVKESENKDYVYEFLDWLYQRENIIELNQKFGYPYPLKDAPEEVTSLPDYLDTPDKLLNLNVGPFMTSVQQLQQDFATIKQGGSVSSSAPQA